MEIRLARRLPRKTVISFIGNQSSAANSTTPEQSNVYQQPVNTEDADVDVSHVDVDGQLMSSSTSQGDYVSEKRLHLLTIIRYIRYK